MSFMITMSQKELHRLEVIQKIRDQRLSVVQAAELLGLSRSQMHRLLRAYDHSGAAGLVSKKRSRPSNRRHSEEFRNAALDLIRERYLDFGPTLAREKLIELHHISVAKETLRQWMTEAGIWVSRRERKKRVFQPRGRRDCFGELIQIDSLAPSPARSDLAKRIISTGKVTIRAAVPSTDLVLIGNHWQTAFVRMTGFGLPGGRNKAALCADRVPLLVDQDADEDHATHDSEIQRRRDTK
ncbi:transposase [Rhizobium leguminosarum]|nr:transposase [Rhizobium leguminosarum]